jgi:large subunit ribosomal protein L6
MSRIGKKLINIPDKVLVEIFETKINISGIYGQLEYIYINKNLFYFEIKNKQLKIELLEINKKTKAYYGLVHSLIQNMIIGVNSKFSKILIAEGVGYKFQIDKNNLIINAGFTHSIKLIIFPDLEINLESPTKLIISGIDKEKVGLFAAQIRQIRPPEPYKGKGLFYLNEIIRRKVGKTAK